MQWLLCSMSVTYDGANEKSSKASIDMLPLLRERNTSFATLGRAVAVL